MRLNLFREILQSSNGSIDNDRPRYYNYKKKSASFFPRIAKAALGGWNGCFYFQISWQWRQRDFLHSGSKIQDGLRDFIRNNFWSREERRGKDHIYYINIYIYYKVSIFDQIWDKTFLQVGISRLVEEGAFNAAFPLHDVNITLTEDKVPLDKNVLLSRYGKLTLYILRSTILILSFTLTYHRGGA